MKILLVSVPPWCSSGYSVQSKNLMLRLRAAGHHVDMLAVYGVKGGVTEWEGFKIYPTLNDPYGCDIMGDYLEMLNPDYVFTMCDTWALKGYGPGMKWVAWTPVDHDPVPKRVRDAIKPAYKVLSMSRHGEQELHNAGIDNTYIPLGVDLDFYRDEKAGRAWRKVYNIEADAFVFGVVGQNVYWPTRKGLDRLLVAWKEFQPAHPKAKLFLHTTPIAARAPTFNLQDLIIELGIEEDSVIFTDQFNLFLGLDNQQMRGMYNSFDCLVLPTHGEGFGVPVVEAQLCGIPVIATNCTSMPELVEDMAGCLVDVQDVMYDTQMAKQYLISIDGLVAAMHEAYENIRVECTCGQCSGYPIKDIVVMSKKGYYWDSVWREFWEPFLVMLEEELNATRAVFTEEGSGRTDDQTILRTEDTGERAARPRRSRSKS